MRIFILLFLLNLPFLLCAQNGCTDSSALNYDSSALVDDGSCITPSCSVAPENWAYCYEVNENGIIATFVENNQGEGVVLEFISGEVEAGWDTFTIYDGILNSDPVLYSGDGDLAGLIIQSTSGVLSIGIDSDGFVSCGSGAQAAINANVYCASEVTPGCTDANACNYNSLSNYDDGTCENPGGVCDDADANTGNDTYQADCECEGETLGCLDSSADNFNPIATLEDNSCLYNDYCSTAEEVICGSTVSGSNTEATSGLEINISNCGPSIDGPGVWYVITGR